MRAVSDRLHGQKAEGERLLSARTAELDEARRELDRGTKLHHAGILADSEFDKLQSQYAVAIENEAAQRAARAITGLPEGDRRRGTASLWNESAGPTYGLIWRIKRRREFVFRF
jgi:hypothetical protein